MADLQEDAVPLQNAAADEEGKKCVYHTLYEKIDICIEFKRVVKAEKKCP